MPFDEKLLDRLEKILALPKSRGPFYELEREIGGSNEMGRLQYALARRQDQRRLQKEAEAAARAGLSDNYGSGGYRRSKTQRRRSQKQRRQRRQSRRN